MSDLSPRALALYQAHGPGPVDWERVAAIVSRAWLPIETAPRAPWNAYGEGQTILLCGGFIQEGKPFVGTGYWKAARTNFWCYTKLGRCPFKPSGWMPLPYAI